MSHVPKTREMRQLVRDYAMEAIDAGECRTCEETCCGVASRIKEEFGQSRYRGVLLAMVHDVTHVVYQIKLCGEGHHHHE